MKPATKLGLLVAVDELITLIVWVALAVLLWKFGERVLAARVGAVIAQPGDRHAWMALVMLTGLGLVLAIGARWLARSIVGLVTRPLIDKASTVRPASDSDPDSPRAE